MSVAIDAFRKRKLNEGSAIKAYKDVQRLVDKTDYGLTSALELLDISEEEYNQGKKLLNEKK